MRAHFTPRSRSGRFGNFLRFFFLFLAPPEGGRGFQQYGRTGASQGRASVGGAGVELSRISRNRTTTTKTLGTGDGLKKRAQPRGQEVTPAMISSAWAFFSSKMAKDRALTKAALWWVLGYQRAAASVLCVRVALCVCRCCCWLCRVGVLMA